MPPIADFFVDLRQLSFPFLLTFFVHSSATACGNECQVRGPAQPDARGYGGSAFFHTGNYHTDTAGCLLTGSYYQLVKGDYRVLHSAHAYKRVYPLLVEQLKLPPKIVVVARYVALALGVLEALKSGGWGPLFIVKDFWPQLWFVFRTNFT